MMGIKELFTIIFSFFNSTFPGPDLSYVALVYWLYSLNITAMAMYSTKVAPLAQTWHVMLRLYCQDL